MDYLKQPLKELKNQIRRIEDNIDIQMHENESWIRESIKDRWLLGKKPDGSLIGLYGSESYALDKFKDNSGAGFGNVDLTLTGSLGKGIQINGFNSQYEVFSTDSKYEDISDKYGEYNFNITPEERELLFNRILSVVLNQSLNKTYELL